jgi:IclR family acetate operon transcriptional repressor
MPNSPRNVGSKTSGVQSIERAVAILKAFSLEKEELGVTELSQRLDLHKSTVSRLLASLHREGLVEENPVTRKYRLGMALVTLGGLVLQRLDVTQVARPLMQGLADTTQETVSLAVRDRDEVVTIAQLSSPQPVRYIGWAGRRVPFHCTSTGKILLAYLPMAEQKAMIARGLPRYTSNTIISSDLLGKELARVREQGYAISQEEFEVGLNEVAVPVRDHTQAVVAALSVSGPAFRLTVERFSTVAAHAQEAALTLSWQLGCSGSANLPDSPANSDE